MYFKLVRKKKPKNHNMSPVGLENFRIFDHLHSKISLETIKKSTIYNMTAPYKQGFLKARIIILIEYMVPWNVHGI